MNYINKIFKNDKDEYISFPSTDDNITCENGQKLRDVLDNFTIDDLNNTTYNKLNTTNKTIIGSINEVNTQCKKIENKVISSASGLNIGCVLRPTTDVLNPWILFSDGAHEPNGVDSITYNSDGTLTLNFDKTYDKIRSFNAHADEMMKIYGLDVGVSTRLDSAKLFLISNLNVGLILRFSADNSSVNIEKGSGFIESATWVSGVGCVVKLKNVPKQSPNTVQTTITNVLHIDATTSITDNREITIKFYKTDGTLIEDITGNWACMINADFSGLVDFNCTSIYDSSILSSMALMYSADIKDDTDETTSTNLKAYDIEIEDVNNNFISTNVEDALEELNIQLKENVITPYKTSFTQYGNNLLDTDTLVSGYVYSNGTIKAGNYKTTSYIPFTNDDKINLSRMDQPETNKLMTRRAIRTACFYDSSYNLLSDFYYNNENLTKESVTYQGSGNVAYIRVSIQSPLIDNAMLYLGEERNEYEPCKLIIDKLELNDTNVLKEKKVLNFGDSIAAGDGNGGVGYSELLANKNGMTCYDYAVGGATITTSTNDILTQIEKAHNDGIIPDYILFDGFTNDINTGAVKELGKISDGYSQTKNVNTFSGAFEEICYRLKTYWKGTHIFYVCVHKMNTRDTSLQNTYSERAKALCERWSIPVIDIYGAGELNTYIADYKILYTNNGDGTHPNELGYNTFYVPLIEKTLKYGITSSVNLTNIKADNIKIEDVNNNFTSTNVEGVLEELNTQVEENQINLVEDDTSMEGISDSVHDTLNTNDKTIIGAINEVNTQCADIAKKTIVEGNKIYLAKSDGTKLDDGTELPTGGSSEADGITIKDENNNFTSGNVEGALNELFQYASNGKGLIATAITGKGVNASSSDTFAQLATKIQQISGSSIASDTALGKKMYSFAVVSDIHYGRTDYSVSEDTNKMLEGLEGLNIDFVCGCGDLVVDSPNTRIPVFKQLWDSKCTKTLYSCTGNHDATVSESVWQQNIGHGFRYSFEKSGDVFIFMSVDNDVNITGTPADFYSESLDWLATKMQEYKGKRIFMFMHYPLYGYSGLRPRQVYGFASNSAESSTIAGYLSSIENLMIFSGHSHQPFYLEKQDPTYNHLKFYEINSHNSATIGMPSIGLPRNFDLSYITDSNPVEGIVVDVYEKGVVFRGYDFVNNNYMDEYTYYLQVENNNAINIVISVEQISINESAHADFTVKLNREIENDVTVYLVNSNDYISLNKSILTFTSNNWNTPQTVRVTASHQADNYDTLLSSITLSCEGANSKNITVTVNNIDVAPITYYSITNNLTGCSSSNNTTQVEENTSYSATITPATNYQMNSITVTMNGTDITSSAVSGNNINITSVTGNVVITAVASEKPEEFSISWEFGNILSGNGANNDQNPSVCMRTNYIPVNSSKHYYFTNVYRTPDLRDIKSPVTVTQVGLYAYDANKTFIARVPGTDSKGKYFTTCRERTDITDKIFGVGSGVKYVRIRMQEQNFKEMETNFEEFKKAIKFEEE